MTATANFRQMAQHIGLAICGLDDAPPSGCSASFGASSEIVNGVFRVAIGVIVAILSTIACSSASFFGYSPFNPYRHGKKKSKTVEQQCRYYEVDNIFVYMVETYLNGNLSVSEDCTTN